MEDEVIKQATIEKAIIEAQRKLTDTRVTHTHGTRTVSGPTWYGSAQTGPSNPLETATDEALVMEMLARGFIVQKAPAE